MNKFKIGDRVVVYGYGSGRSGRNWEITGEVEKIFEDNKIIVSHKGEEYMCHPKQCRRLVKKKTQSVANLSLRIGSLVDGLESLRRRIEILTEGANMLESRTAKIERKIKFIW